MSQVRQIASYVHDVGGRADILDQLDRDRQLPAEVRGADYAANRLQLAAELSRSRADHADILDRIGMRPVYTFDQRAELAAVSVATPANPQVATMVPGGPLVDRWTNITEGRTVTLGRDLSASRVAEVAQDQAVRAEPNVEPLRPGLQAVAEVNTSAPEPPPPPTAPPTVVAVR